MPSASSCVTAARWQAGHAEEDVARWMGYVDTGPMKRYRHLLTAPVAGLA